MSRTRKDRRVPDLTAPKHRSDLAFCGCATCNRGMHHGLDSVQYERRKFRRVVKQALRRTEDGADIPTRHAVGYTD